MCSPQFRRASFASAKASHHSLILRSSSTYANLPTILGITVIKFEDTYLDVDVHGTHYAVPKNVSAHPTIRVSTLPTLEIHKNCTSLLVLHVCACGHIKRYSHVFIGGQCIHVKYMNSYRAMEEGNYDLMPLGILYLHKNICNINICNINTVHNV